MKFSQTLKITKTELVVSNRYDRWMERNSNPEYSLDALDFGRKALFDQGSPRDRRGTFSASSLNSCKRRQQFTFIGMPEIKHSSRTAAILQNGTFMHIRWQMAGLSEGFFKAVEVPVGENSLRLSGTQDAVAHDGTIVELKSIHTNGFSGIRTFGPKEDHLHQGGTYLAATGAEKVSFIYEDKNAQEYVEYVKTADELPIQEIKDQAARLWENTENRELYPILDKCYEGKGRYLYCPFRDNCLKVKSWTHAEEIVND